MKRVITFLKISVFLLTSFWGLAMGIFAPICIINGDLLNNPELASHPIFLFWIFNSILYISACILLFLNHGKSAAIVSIVAFVGVLIIHSVLDGFRRWESEISASGLYLPNIFITILIIIAAVIMNWSNITDYFIKSEEKKNAPAPSILDPTKTVSVNTKKERK